MSITKRAALYARFSTDMQNDRSVDDQLDLCASFARSQGFEVTCQFHDRARSGTTMHGRDGLSRLLEDARAGRFDVIVVEALDRLSRDQEDLAGLHKRLTFLGIKIIAVHDGIADQIQVGIRGLVSALYITDLKHKIRRGMGGVVADGRTAGGRAYGYRPTPGQPGMLQIDEAEASVVRRIFAEYTQGRSARDIARGLNDDLVPTARAGAHWTASTINGDPQRGSGILNNALYRGEIVWNRLRMVRDPETGKRVSRENPRDEWRRSEAPHLRIVDQDTWQAAEHRRLSRPRSVAAPLRAMDKRSTRLLTGLIRCERCGGGLSMHDHRAGVRRVTCSTAKESGSCDNRRRYRLDLIERAVVSALVERLSEPDAVAAWLAQVQADESDASRRRAKAERGVVEARAKVDRLQMALIEGRIDGAFFDAQIAPARAELAAREGALQHVRPANVVVLHPAALADMAAMLAVVAEHLPDVDPRKNPEIVSAVRSLIQKVVIHDAADGGVECEIVGTIAPLLGGKSGFFTVAEEGLEPPTRGL